MFWFNIEIIACLIKVFQNVSIVLSSYQNNNNHVSVAEVEISKPEYSYCIRVKISPN